MRKTIKFSQQYHVYYVFGSEHSGCLTAPTRVELAALKSRMVASLSKDDAVEAVRFDDIWKTVSTEIKARMDIKIAEKVTNPYW